MEDTYLFWFEDEGREGWHFEIKAKDHIEAFELAYDTHGPQVEGMMYEKIQRDETTSSL